MNFRNAALVFAALLVVNATWTMAGEIGRLRSAANVEFPTAIFGDAASVGIIRGDLWTEEMSSAVFSEHLARAGRLAPEAAATLRSAAERALASEPLNARAWLVLATLSWRAGSPQALVDEQLKMSYYTAPNDQAVMRHRLMLAARSSVFGADLTEVVRREIRTVMLHVPELRPVVIAAFRAAQKSGRDVIKATVSEIDPGFVAELQQVH